MDESHPQRIGTGRGHRLILNQGAGYRPRLESSQRAFKAWKKTMSGTWRLPAPKLKMAIWSQQRVIINTPNTISGRCTLSPKKRS